MSSIEPTEQTPEVEVTIWRDGELVSKHLCDTAEEAADYVDLWADASNVQVSVHAVGAEPSLDDPEPEHLPVDEQRST